MKYDFESNKLIISVSELSFYAYRRENPELMMKKYGFIKNVVKNSSDQKSAGVSSAILAYKNNIDNMETEVLLEKEIMLGEFALSVIGYANIISFDGILHTVEEIKTVSYFPHDMSPFTEPSHFAEASIYAYLLAEKMDIPEVKIKLTYVKRSTGDRVTFAAKFTKISLQRMFEALIDRAFVCINAFVENKTIFLDECQKLPFPYKTIRSGQEEFIKKAYRTIKNGETLLVSAPTGTGKTISSIFPALKALASDRADKIFYFTAKTVTGRAAVEACEHISKYAPHLRAIMICSKEQICPYKKQTPALNFKTACKHCDKLDDLVDINDPTKIISYRERQISALSHLLTSENRIYTIERLIKVAGIFNVCPTELALDLSEYCDIIICDYNYIIDDRIKFRRYFKNVKNTDRYVFLFDEAHNLPDRTRNTYSAVFSNKDIAAIIEEYEDILSENSTLDSMIKDYKSALDEVILMCTESESFIQTDKGEVRIGYCNSTELPSKLMTAAGNLYEVIGKLIREDAALYDFLADLYSDVSDIVFAAGFFDEKFRFFASRENDELLARILCIDPSGIIENVISAARAVIMFSATLSPIEYYKEVVGCDTAETLEVSSPFEKDNLCLIVYDTLSTRLTDRRDTANECAEIITEAIETRPGKYMVYFPSYDYMKRVCKAFARIAPEDCGIIMQRRGMSYGERERFIDMFRDSTRKFIVGFCVLGGMFSEGIDLAGESLIGAFVVGTGMPQLSAERNIMAMYYDEKNERGHEFAYTCPGMNKVLQAAGRVIRTENDHGVVVLLDDRYGDMNMKMMFPPHWRHVKYTGDVESMKSILSDFWEKNN